MRMSLVLSSPVPPRSVAWPSVVRPAFRRAMNVSFWPPPGDGLGPAGDTREILGVRHTRDVDGARRRRDRDRDRSVAVAASAEVGRLLERRQARVQARYEAIQGVREVDVTQSALRSPLVPGKFGELVSPTT